MTTVIFTPWETSYCSSWTPRCSCWRKSPQWSARSNRSSRHPTSCCSCGFSFFFLKDKSVHIYYYMTPTRLLYASSQVLSSVITAVQRPLHRHLEITTIWADVVVVVAALRLQQWSVRRLFTKQQQQQQQMMMMMLEDDYWRGGFIFIWIYTLNWVFRYINYFYGRLCDIECHVVSPHSVLT